MWGIGRSLTLALVAALVAVGLFGCRPEPSAQVKAATAEARPPAATASGASTALPSPTSSATPTPTPFWEPPFAPFDLKVTESLDVKAAPLSELAPNAQAFLNEREEQYGVAVILPDSQKIYVSNGDVPMAMASVCKVAVMTAVMDRSMKEGRDLTLDELYLLEAMITVSDNVAAQVLWDQIGGGDAIRSYLESVGVSGIWPVESREWGDSTATAVGVAQLLAKIAFGDILDEPRRQLALELLANVALDQRWGVTSGAIPDTVTVVGVKDGWYPAETGWWVNSAGVFLAEDGRPVVVMAVLTEDQPSFEYGVETIEGVASRVWEAVNGFPISEPSSMPEASATVTSEASPTATEEPSQAVTSEASPIATEEPSLTATSEASPTAEPEPSPTATPEAENADTLEALPTPAPEDLSTTTPEAATDETLAIRVKLLCPC